MDNRIEFNRRYSSWTLYEEFPANTSYEVFEPFLSKDYFLKEPTNPRPLGQIPTNEMVELINMRFEYNHLIISWHHGFDNILTLGQRKTLMCQILHLLNDYIGIDTREFNIIIKPKISEIIHHLSRRENPLGVFK